MAKVLSSVFWVNTKGGAGKVILAFKPAGALEGNSDVIYNDFAATSLCTFLL